MPRKNKKQCYSDILLLYDKFETRLNITTNKLYFYNPVN